MTAVTVVMDSEKNILRIFTSRPIALESIKSWYAEEDVKVDVDSGSIGCVKICWNNTEKQPVYYVQTQYIYDEVA